MESVFSVPAFRYASADQMNRMSQQDPASAKAFAAELTEQPGARRLVYHPSAGVYLQRQREGVPSLEILPD